MRQWLRALRSSRLRAQGRLQRATRMEWSKSGVRSRLLPFPTIRHLTISSPFADASSLALVAEKLNAHSDNIRSVGFNNNGTKIVSGSDDKTIKVWDAGVNADTYHSPLNQ